MEPKPPLCEEMTLKGVTGLLAACAVQAKGLSNVPSDRHKTYLMALRAVEQAIADLAHLRRALARATTTANNIGFPGKMYTVEYFLAKTQAEPETEEVGGA